MANKQRLSSETFGELLCFLRKRAHLTQSELALLVGYSDAQINRLERGVRAPDPGMIAARFVTALGLQPDSDEATRLIDLARVASGKDTFRQLESAAGIGSPADISRPANLRLPSPTTELLGRASDLQATQTILSPNSARMLTLIGPPGVGKTRLAIQLGLELERQYRDGVLFVSLVAAADGSLIADTVLQAMGITSTSQAPLDQIKNILRRRNMLIILDNYEHLLEVDRADLATGFVAELLAYAPNIKVLITSRVPLRLRGEHLYDVPTLAPAEAAALFIQRTTALNPSFKFGNQDEQVILEICRRLDYLPLAIELASARTRLFEPAALLKRLANPLVLLTTGANDLPPHQRKLRSAIGWSYELLTFEERALFRRISVFVDGCTMPLIEAVALNDFSDSVVNLTQSLVDKSLLKSEWVNGVIRFRMLEMLREYATEQLTIAGESVTIKERSAQWFVDQVQEMQSDPAIGDSAIWFDWFDAEVNNLRAIIQWSMQSNAIEYAMQLVANLGVTWRLHGPLQDGFNLISLLLAHPKVRDDAHLYARVLQSAAHVAEQVGEAELSEECLINALAIFKQVDDKGSEAYALSHMGDHAITRADYSTARLLIEEGIALAREAGDPRILTYALLWLGTIEHDQGNIQRALIVYDEATRYAHASRSPIMAFMAYVWTAAVYQTIGEYDRARELAEQSLEICTANKLTSPAQVTLGILGSITLFQGDVDHSISYLDSAREVQERSGDIEMWAGTLINLGFAHHVKGDTAKGKSMIKEGLQVHWSNQRKNGIPFCLIRLAWIAVDQHKFGYAVRLMGAVAGLNEKFSLSFPENEQIFHQPRLEAAQQGLSHADYEAFCCEGQAMDIKTAVDYALGE